LVNILYGRNLQGNLLETMRLRFQNADLVVALTHQKEAVEQASLAKTRFLAAASHDLRQPVQAIELFVDVLDQDLKDTPATVMLNRIRAAGRGLETLLNALLDFRKLMQRQLLRTKNIFRFKRFLMYFTPIFVRRQSARVSPFVL